MTLAPVGNRGISMSRGALTMAFGLASLVWPHMTLDDFVMLFGAYAVVDGLAALGFALRAPEGRSRLLWLESGAGITLGVLAWASLVVTVIPLVLIATWGVFSAIAAVIALSLELTGDWALRMSTTSAAVLGMLLMVLLGESAIEVARAVGLCALVFGALVLLLAVPARGRRGVLVQARRVRSPAHRERPPRRDGVGTSSAA